MASPLSIRPSQVSGEVFITVPVKCVGPAALATVKLYVFEGSIWPTHGTLIAEYSQQVEFMGGQTLDVVFAHTIVARGGSRRDVGIEVIVEDRVVASAEFDDVFEAVTTGGGMDISGMMGMMVMLMAMGMVVPMLSGEEVGDESATI